MAPAYLNSSDPKSADLSRFACIANLPRRSASDFFDCCNDIATNITTSTATRVAVAIVLAALASASATAQGAPALGSSVRVHGLEWDIHEVTIAQVQKMAQATGFVSRAEKEGGGYVYESGWVQKRGWTWRTPFGIPGRDNEPAVHLSFDEAQSVCKFYGKRLPNDKEWTDAAYLEQRSAPPAGFIKGKRYPYPNGDSAVASHCLNDCGGYQGTAPAGTLNRGVGAVPAMTTPPGVNGLYEMGGNVWEWVDTGRGDERITRSSSWWYGASRQREGDVATKPRDTRVVYIGFRCVR